MVGGLTPKLDGKNVLGVAGFSAITSGLPTARRRYHQ